MCTVCLSVVCSCSICILSFPPHTYTHKVDLDGNGLINFAEFVMMMRKCKVDTDFDRQIREAFKVKKEERRDRENIRVLHGNTGRDGAWRYREEKGTGDLYVDGTGWDHEVEISRDCLVKEKE